MAYIRTISERQGDEIGWTETFGNIAPGKPDYDMKKKIAEHYPAVEHPVVRTHPETGRKMPLVRDVDVSYYLRQEKTGLNLGPYERNCKAHWVTPDDPMPEDFSFQLLDEDWDHFEPMMINALHRLHQSLLL